MKKTLWAILVLGFVCRLLYLGGRQLDTDELLLATAVRGDSAAALLNRFGTGALFPVPLNVLAQKLSVILLGESNWALRFPSVLFSTLSLWVLFRAATYLFGERVALCTTALLAILPLHYHFSQEAGPGSLFFLLSLVSYDCLLRNAAGSQAGWISRLGLAVALTLLFYTSPLAAFVVASQFICLLFAPAITDWNKGECTSAQPPGGDASHRLRMLAVYTSCALASLALFYPWARFAWVPGRLASLPHLPSWRFLYLGIKELGDNSYPATLILLIGACIGFYALRRHKQFQRLRWLLVWLFSLVPMPLLCDSMVRSHLSTTCLIPLSAPLVLLAGYGVSFVGERLTILDEPPIQVSAPAIAYLVLSAAVSTFIAHRHWQRVEVDWAGAASYLKTKLSPGDELTVPIGASLLEYYEPIELYRMGRLDPGSGKSVDRPGIRRAVVCADGARPDPCRAFRKAAGNDPAWSRLELRGLTVFERPK